MVKNTKGGSKAKKFGRKFTGPPVNNNLRLSVDSAEVYACCSKIYGGPNIEVKCVDGIDRLCIMRNKFRGRGKRDNTIEVGTWVLVGLREFETVKEGKKETCDLLEVYREADKDKLQQNAVTVNWKILKEIKGAREGNIQETHDDDLFEFSDNRADEISEMINNSETTMLNIQEEEEEDDIDINDI